MRAHEHARAARHGDEERLRRQPIGMRCFDWLALNCRFPPPCHVYTYDHASTQRTATHTLHAHRSAMHELVLVVLLLCAAAHAQKNNVCIAAASDSVSLHEKQHQPTRVTHARACRTASSLLLVRPLSADPHSVSPPRREIIPMLSVPQLQTPTKHRCVATARTHACDRRFNFLIIPRSSNSSSAATHHAWATLAQLRPSTQPCAARLVAHHPGLWLRPSFAVSQDFTGDLACVTYSCNALAPLIEFVRRNDLAKSYHELFLTSE
jgi:hypothetical protein